MKLTAKLIPIDLRRRRALESAHAHEVKTAVAAFRHRDSAYEPQPWDWPKDHEPQRRGAVLNLPTRKFEGEMP